jgi:hypothetical protein
MLCARADGWPVTGVSSTDGIRLRARDLSRALVFCLLRSRDLLFLMPYGSRGTVAEEDAKFFQFIPLARLRAQRRPVSKFQVALPPRAAHSRRR